ncbi:hypothetical protein HN371_10335 [Candidatus Poribacteria bacterium]|jgi:hypothetical protein|nr:hypothetical protein [Candidatus Poribacteria bacterium]MBT5535263.1 hypothetical protein [Candidatus Poribacteria bacterium]MBT5714857.1 hypothetical protein [Candidatus Poribacteria bacterium]MBT7101054.1 hypothetical protein [Candidatus Poribacteria bacterium]MBT7807140.1 hypothetical protein [Candidatus Poribacteria bacterium]
MRVTYRFAAACVVGFACLYGCARLAEVTGYNEATIPEGAAIEHVMPTDDGWKAIAVNKPMGNVNARTDVPQRWASPNYGTSDWLPAVAGPAVGSDSELFADSKWVWYPERDFAFGGVNSIPGNRRVVHFRREFYNEAAAGDLSEAYLDVMVSGAVTVRVFVNGRRLHIETDKGDVVAARARGGQLRGSVVHGAIRDMLPRRYAFAEHVVYGKNVVGIEATTHIANDVNGRPVPNYVRDGVIARVTVR